MALLFLFISEIKAKRKRPVDESDLIRALDRFSAHPPGIGVSGGVEILIRDGEC
jgi:hypothetical protein